MELRYALISDIHANVQALDAVLADIALADVAATYHIGDLVGYGAMPNETIARLRECGIQGVAGNYDSTVATGYKHCGCKNEGVKQEELAHVSFAFTCATTSSTSKQFLAGLPFMMDVRPNGGHTTGPRLVLVHGTPVRNTQYWTEDRSDEFCKTMAARVDLQPNDVIAFGHTHKPWHREVSGIHFINTGSVGRPKDGDWRAGYVLLQWHNGIPQVEFKRVTYDIDGAVAALNSAGLPTDFAAFLRSGGTYDNGVV